MANLVNRPGDPGLQPQRTGMAWSRTLFLTLVVSLLCFRFGLWHASPLILLCCVLLLGLAGMMALMGIRRFQFDPQHQAVCTYRSHATIALTAGGLVLTALIFACRFLLTLLG